MASGYERFPTTRWSAIEGARSQDAAERARSFGALIAAYWRPAYKHTRRRWNKPPGDAQDLTQGFFARAMEKDLFAPFDPKRARFRTFLRTCLDGYLANEEKAAARQKRGGDVELLSLDFEGAEAELERSPLPSTDSPERLFDREWSRSVFTLAVEALKAELEAAGKAQHYLLFERYDLSEDAAGRPTYAQPAAEVGTPVTQVTNHLAFARRELRRLVLSKLRELTASEEEFRSEARDLLGIEVA